MIGFQSSPLISVIIPVYDGAGTLTVCLDAVVASAGAALEVIVVDDGSGDESGEVAGRYPCRLIRLPRNQGAAAARNIGARAATGALLFFLDADIRIEPGALATIAQEFQRQPHISALFGSYQAATIPQNFCSVYKNLLHHYTHQTSDAAAATFCGGFGAIRREVFQAFGGFDIRHRHLEDIELGYRLHQAGHRILLHKDLQFTHLKRYTLASLVRSDLFQRAIPWTQLMWEKRILRRDLNTRTHNLLSAPVSLALAAALPLAFVRPGAGLTLAVVLTVVLIALNAGFFQFVWRVRGFAFLLRAIAMTWLFYLYSVLGLILGTIAYLFPRASRQGSPERNPSL